MSAAGPQEGVVTSAVDVSEDALLEALRQQLGEVAWGDRLAAARRREQILVQVAALRATGVSAAAAAAACGSSLERVASWRRRHARDGLAGLIARQGRVGGTENAVLKRPAPSGESKRGRTALNFVKWTGSKASVVHRLVRFAPTRFGTYYEPMAGAGTLFNVLAPPGRAVLGDLNPELMTCYAVIRDAVDALLAALARHQNTYEHFIAVRAQDPLQLAPVEQAARFIYLNKTCFNGLYRLNARGRFNVPYGRIGHANFRDEEALRRWAARLSKVELRTGDYLDTLADARRGDFIYFDPPYLNARGGTDKHVRYQAGGFGPAAHEALARTFRDLDQRGCKVLLSNLDSPAVRALYSGYYFETFTLRRMVHFDPQRRTGYTELVVSNRPRTALNEQLALL